MIDYHGFWLGFVVLFGLLPALIGGAGGLAWGWRNGRRGAGLIGPVVAAGLGATILVFAAAVLLFRG